MTRKQAIAALDKFMSKQVSVLVGGSGARNWLDDKILAERVAAGKWDFSRYEVGCTVYGKRGYNLLLRAREAIAVLKRT